ncbi:MAG: carboxypeptidase-like regulatory domain-containing protein [Rhizobacter sp.]|nr:carboxypeptidase-like regulatory domain-containing protein [Ferruginibacter sp.]
MKIGLQRFLLIISFISIAFSVRAQTSLGGNIFDRRNNKPLQNVSVSIKKKNIGSLSDKKGHFEISAAKLKKTDTLVISSVGYSTIKIPVSDAFLLKDYFLAEDSKNLEDVVVKAYKNHSSEGSVSEVTGYFRGWNTRKGGGEIGRIINVRSDDFKVEKVRFKANNQCDTCIVRLHIRDLKNGLPDMDLLRDSLTIEIHKSSFDDRFAEFDLTDKNIIIKKSRYVFVSLETISCNSKNNGSCSLAYIGTEEGNYLYRTRDYRAWEESTSHSLYLKMFYTY